MLLERLGLHQCQGRIPSGSGSVKVPPIAKYPCICRHRWNSNPTPGPFVKRMAMQLGHFTVISLAEIVATLDSDLHVAKMVIMPSISKASPFLTGSVWPLSVTTSKCLVASPAARSLKQQSRPSQLHYTEKVRERKLNDGAKQPIDLHTQKPFEHWAWWNNGWMFSTCLASPGVGTVESRRSASDVSGEAGSEQGWSVLGPPGKSASGIPNLTTSKKKPGRPQRFRGSFGCRTLRFMVRETVPSQQLLYHSTANG